MVFSGMAVLPSVAAVMSSTNFASKAFRAARSSSFAIFATR